MPSKVATRRVLPSHPKNRRHRSTAPSGNGTLPAPVDSTLFSAMSLRISPPDTRERRLTGPEIERALISGEHAPILETYFGEAEYAELRALAAQATRRTRDPGPRVLILPGILGSMLAEVNGNDRDVIWVDFVDIMLGRLHRLALTDENKRGFAAVDVHQSTYLKLKLSLRAEGFDADFHPFDWRQSISDLGRELARRIAGDPAQEIFLVAHSMGGLVARAAVHHGAGEKLARLVMLGTPNYGSFAPAMVYRCAYPFLNKIAVFDLKNSAADLAGRVFNTHPGLAQMLPHRSKFDRIDLYDVQNWPRQGVRPLHPILSAAPGVQQQLAILPAKFVMIAGVDRETTVGLSLSDKKDEFVFQRSRAGDGTVPLDLAVLPDVLTYYCAEDHGTLPKNATVQKAVGEIIRNGTTSLLADNWVRTRADAVVELGESEMRQRAAAQVKRSVTDFSASDLRGVISEFAAPATLAASAPPVVPLVGSSTIAEPDWKSLFVGRRNQRRIEVQLARGSLTQVKSRAYLIGVFQNVEPGGAALAIDNLMNGTLREFRQRRMFAAGAGEVLIIPTGRSEVTAEFVVVAGLGHFEAFNTQVLETIAENVARTLARMDIEEFATVTIGSGTGLNLEQSMRALLCGFFRGLEDADPRQLFRAITFCEVDESRFSELKWTLYKLWSTSLCERVEVILSEERLPPAPTMRRGGRRDLPPCMYLDVRARPAPDGRNLVFETSLLTTGAKAAVLAGSLHVDPRALAAHLAKIEKDEFRHAYLPEFGTTLARLILPDVIAAGLEGSPHNHLVIVHDAEASRIPWETLCLNGKFPALNGGMSRRYLAPNLSVAKWLEQRRQDATLEVLLVVNPTRDLDGAEEEGKRIEALFGPRPEVRLTIIHGHQATRDRLRKEFSSGKYDILHYAGHAAFVPSQPARSGIVCSDGPLTGAELVELGNLPSVVFFNACESARVRKRITDEGPRVTRSIHERIERGVGLAEAFMRGGVANYIGTYWPVGDLPAKTFASVFYQKVLDGDTLAQALSAARFEIDKLRSEDWADYIYYGSVDFAVKEAGPPVS